MTRPEPGIARGHWEAPLWVFWGMFAIVVLGTAAYVLRRLGVLRPKHARPKIEAASLPSTGVRRP